MDKNEFEKFLGEMPLEAAEKAGLIADFEGGVPAQQCFDKIKALLEAKEEALKAANPEVAAQHEAADREYQEAVMKASGDFDGAMAQINKEADEVGQEMLKRLDQARAEEIKDSI